MFLRRHLSLIVLGSLLVLAGCGDDQSQASNNRPADRQDEPPPLAKADTLLAGAPSNDELPSIGKADAVYPDKFTELVDLQSPVRDQGHRGVCSIFSSIALVEHLYIKEGTMQTPDFSEQYLNWSTKVQEGAFPNTGGSTARDNLEAVVDYGVVEEDVWPYDVSGWGPSDNPDCEGDSMPTVCYTNGDPPEAADDAQLFDLPDSGYLSTRPDDIKAYMTENKAGVVVGLDFFYQAWNHGGSSLPINRDYSHKGYVVYPNDTDKQKSLEDRAGHSILLVGWDDTLEVRRMNADGEPMVDDNGDPVVEKGFYIFKNSWGTGSFGRDNPYGDGYGFISMKYVEEYGSATVADVPELQMPDEVCGDGIDNDENGQTDCDDSACTEHASCQDTSETQTPSKTPMATIPDNDPAGVTSTIEISEPGDVASLSVSLDITHSYIGDVSATLESPSGDTVDLIDVDRRWEDDLHKTYVVDQFNGTPAKGVWTLTVVDSAHYDEGTLNEWGMELTY